MSVRYIPALLLLQTHIPQSHGYITECPLVNNILFSTFLIGLLNCVTIQIVYDRKKLTPNLTHALFCLTQL